MNSSDKNWTSKEFLKAILIDRFVPLSIESEKIGQRIETLSSFLDFLLTIHLTVPPTEKEVSLKSSEIISKVVLAFETLQKQQNFEEAKTRYLKALDLLIDGIKLDRGDEKKWPSLNPDQKAIRLLSNYFSDSPVRFLYEKEFRSFHAVMHLSLARDYLKQNLLSQSEQETIFAQEEIRHIAGLCLKIELAEIREEAETISQTSNRPEREVTLEIFDRILSSSQEEVVQFLEKLNLFLAKGNPPEDFVKKFSEKVFVFKKVSSVSTLEQLIDLVQSQPQNIEIDLSPTCSIDWKLFFQKIFHIPHSENHTYFRMPDVDRFLNLSVKNSNGKLLIRFDEHGRLIQAPSASDDSDSTLLDVAIIGAGPGGISAAVNLIKSGVYKYVVLERTAPNSTVRDIWSREKEADTFYSGPPDPIEGFVGMQDTTRAVFLNRMNSFIDYFHLNIQSGVQVNALRREKDFWILETTSGEYRARAVLMTAGRYGKPKLLKWEEGALPETLRKRIIRGVEVDQIRHSSVLVIGGGNTAFDNVKTLTANGTGKKGNLVSISYPRKPFNVPASMHAHNNDQLMQWEAENKIKILWNSNPEKVELFEDKSLEKVQQQFKVTFREENLSPLLFDYIAPAVGWQIDKEIMEKAGVNFIEGKNPDIDSQTGQAYGLNPQGERVPLEGLWIAGDYAVQKSVPAAFSSNFRAVTEIVKKLKKQ